MRAIASCNLHSRQEETKTEKKTQRNEKPTASRVMEVNKVFGSIRRRAFEAGEAGGRGVEGGGWRVSAAEH